MVMAAVPTRPSAFRGRNTQLYANVWTLCKARSKALAKLLMELNKWTSD